MPPHLLFIVIGAAISNVAGVVNATRSFDVPWRFAVRTAATATLGALVGGHLASLVTIILTPAGYPWPTLEQILIPWMGFRAPGALIGVVLVYLTAGLRAPQTMARMADGTAVFAGLGVAVARHGCAITGCCRPLAGWYAATGYALVAAGLLLQRRKRYDGHVALWIVFLYSVAAVALETFRIGPVFWGPLPQLQWLAIVMLAVSGSSLALAESYHRRSMGLAGTIATNARSGQ